MKNSPATRDVRRSGSMGLAPRARRPAVCTAMSTPPCASPAPSRAGDVTDRSTSRATRLVRTWYRLGGGSAIAVPADVAAGAPRLLDGEAGVDRQRHTGDVLRQVGHEEQDGVAD